MKTYFISCFLFLPVLIFCNYEPGQPVLRKHYETREAMKSDACIIVASFNQFIRESGYELPSLPEIIIRTEPSLIRLDAPGNAIIVPFWQDLPDDQKALFKSWRGENAEEFFILMFNWFFIPHEMGHFINPMIYEMNPYQNEKEANQVAITFFRRNPGNSEKLDSVKKQITQVLEILPKIDFGDMPEEEYFNANYQKMGNNPNEYGYFQLKFILDLLNNKTDFSIRQYFDKRTR